MEGCESERARTDPDSNVERNTVQTGKRGTVQITGWDFGANGPDTLAYWKSEGQSWI